MEVASETNELEAKWHVHRRSLNNLLGKHVPVELLTITISSGVFVDGIHRGNVVEKNISLGLVSIATLKHLGTVLLTGLRGSQIGAIEERLGLSNLNLEIEEQVQESTQDEL